MVEGENREGEMGSGGKNPYTYKTVAWKIITIKIQKKKKASWVRGRGINGFKIGFAFLGGILEPLCSVSSPASAQALQTTSVLTDFSYTQLLFVEECSLTFL